MHTRLFCRPRLAGLLMAGILLFTSLLAPVTARADETGGLDAATLARIDRHNLIQWGMQKSYLPENPSDHTIVEWEARDRFAKEGRACNGMSRFAAFESMHAFTVGDLIGMAFESVEGVSRKEVTSGPLRSWANQQGFRSLNLCNLDALATRYDLMDVLYHLSADGAEVDKGVLRAPYFNQVLGYYIGKEGDIWHHGEWGDTTFKINGHTLGVAGCGFTVTAMALSYCLDRIVAPTEYMENGQYTGDGAQHSVGEFTARQYGLPVTRTNDWGAALAALRQGYPVMALESGPSFWSQNGHYILMVGALSDGTIAVYNPGLIEQTYRTNGGISYETSKITDTQAQDGAYTIFGLGS
ncbi:MAG: C39 family peptidase [Lachnospiraceae bacterium]|nr:C39 family peptidase [Lachnospiraceae bacterium]